MKSVTVRDLYDRLDALFPFAWAEAWDRSGLQVGRWDESIRGVVLAVDADETVLDFAHERNANVLVVHHPLLLGTPRPLAADGEHPLSRTAHRAVREGYSILSLHTNADKAPWGFNRDLAHDLGLLGLVTLSPTGETPPPWMRAGRQDAVGYGKVGEFKSKVTLDALLRRIRRATDTPWMRVSRWADLKSRLQRLALVGGSGMSHLDAALRAGAQALLTGDAKYHAARETDNLILIDISHAHSERHFAANVAGHLRDWLRRHAVAAHVYLDSQEPMRIHE